MVQCLRGLLIGWEGAPPRFVVMDADDSIGAAVEQVFPDAKIIVCCRRTKNAGSCFENEAIHRQAWLDH